MGAASDYKINRIPTRHGAGLFTLAGQPIRTTPDFDVPDGVIVTLSGKTIS